AFRAWLMPPSSRGCEAIPVSDTSCQVGSPTLTESDTVAALASPPDESMSLRARPRLGQKATRETPMRDGLASVVRTPPTPARTEVARRVKVLAETVSSKIRPTFLDSRASLWPLRKATVTYVDFQESKGTSNA